MIEKMKEIWKKWFGKEHEKTTKKVTKFTEKKEKTDHMLQKLEAYLFKLYDFRFNLLTEQTDANYKASFLQSLQSTDVLPDPPP